MRVLLRGYYGFNNLGDDLLLITSLELIKSILPSAEITIMTAGSAEKIKALGITHQVIPIGADYCPDLVFHGGGGTYYDFESAGFRYSLLNKFINFIGLNIWTRVYHLISSPSSMGKPRPLRIGFGLGIGNFSKDSAKYYYKMAELAKFDHLFIRDKKSIENLKELGVKTTVTLTTDMVFLKRFWYPQTLELSKPGQGIALVLKYWKDHQMQLYTKELVSRLRQNGSEITLYLFEQEYDQPLRDEYNDLPIVVYDPRRISLGTFLSKLASNKLIISSRAHGMILASALSRPCIGLSIEPKISKIQTLLPNASKCINSSLPWSEVYKLLESASHINPETVASDFEKNQQLVLKSVEIFKEVLKCSGKYDADGHERV